MMDQPKPIAETIPFTRKESAAIKTGPILIVDDNESDRRLIKKALETLNIPNKLIEANGPLQAMEIMKEGSFRPFLIISDINMPKMTGMDFKRAIEDSEEMRMKGIPFIFMSTSTDRSDIRDAYKVSAQGYFEKCNDWDMLTKQLKIIVDYWDFSEVPIIY